MFLFAPVAIAAAPVEVEIVTERGVQITAPRQWLQLFTSLGIEQVRIRTARPGDRPRLENRGSDDRPRFLVVGILSAKEILQLPGGTFRLRDRGRLSDYFDRLGADGVEGVTSPTGRFGLTNRQLAILFEDLSQTIGTKTKGLPPSQILESLRAKFALKISITPEAARTLRDAEPVADKVENLTAGTGLAIVLRRYGLMLQPKKERGKPVVHRIDVIDPKADAWPIGWEPEQKIRQLAPTMMETLNVEIEGYSLQEALDAIGPRTKIPFYLDHTTLAQHKIDPSMIQVRVPRTRTFYKRILDRVLSQARLAGKLRIDETGTVFLWISK